MRRVLRSEVVWALVPLLVASGLVLENGGWPWRGDWNWTIDTITGSTVLTGPLLGGLCAWAVLRAAPLRLLTDTTPRRALVVVRQVAETLGIGLIAYALTAFVGVAITLSVPHGGSPGWLALLIGPLVLALCATVGAVLGLHVPHPLTALAVPVGLFLLGDLAPRPGPELLRHGPVTGSLAGLTFDPAVLGRHGLALVGLTALGLLATLPARRIAPLPRARILLATVGVVLGGAGLVLTIGAPAERFILTAERPDVCGGRTVVVCLPASQQRHLDRLLAGLEPAARRLEAEGAELPDRFEPALPGRLPPPGVGLLTRSIDDRLPTDPATMASLLVRPAACPAYVDPAARPTDEDAVVSELLIAVTLADDPEAPVSPDLRGWLERTPAPERRAWVTSTYAALAECDLEAVRLPASLRAGLPE